MLSSNSLLAAMAVLALIVVSLVNADTASSETEKKMQSFCRTLIDNINVANPEDREQVFKAGYEYLKKPLILSVKSIVGEWNRGFADAWMAARKTISGQQECSLDSGEHIAILMSCHRTGILNNTMRMDTNEYHAKCIESNPQYWDAQLGRLSGDKNPHEKKYNKVTKFLDDNFIETYMRDNYGEQIDFSGHCCDPLKSSKPSYDAFFSIGLKSDEAALMKLREKPDEIESINKKVLAKPCAAYVGTLSGLMWVTESVSQIVRDKQKAFLESLSQDFKNTIFRYNFCAKLLYPGNTMDSYLEMIAWNVLNPDMSYNLAVKN